MVRFVTRGASNAHPATTVVSVSSSSSGSDQRTPKRRRSFDRKWDQFHNLPGNGILSPLLFFRRLPSSDTEKEDVPVIVDDDDNDDDDDDDDDNDDDDGILIVRRGVFRNSAESNTAISLMRTNGCNKQMGDTLR